MNELNAHTEISLRIGNKHTYKDNFSFGFRVENLINSEDQKVILECLAKVTAIFEKTRSDSEAENE